MIPHLRQTALATTRRDSSPAVTLLSLEEEEEEAHRRSERCCRAVVGCCHQARYTCPKCHVPYCSVTCYQRHSGGDAKDGRSCTEEFYKHRVSQVLQLEVKEKSNDVRHMLNSVHQQRCNPVEQHPVQNKEAHLSQKELVQLLSLMEQYENDDDGMARVLSSLSPRVQATVERVTREHALGSGDASLNDWFLEPWYPWWRTELVALDSQDEDESLDAESETEPIKTLDERIMAVPSFDTIFRPKKSTLQPLQYNLVDILQSAVGMLRLYHGVDNAVELPVEAYHSVVQGSMVLSQDARFDSLEDVLADCARRLSTKRALGIALSTDKGCSSTPWTVLSHDVVLMSQNHRLVARALLETSDVINAAISKQKKSSAADVVSEMRRVRKKLQFYLSWSLAHRDRVARLSTSISDWVADWKMPADDEYCGVVSLLELQLPSETSKTSGGRWSGNRDESNCGGLLLEEVL